MSSELQELKDKVAQLETTIEVLMSEAQLKSSKPLMNKHGLPLGLRIYAEVEDVGMVWLKANPTNYQVTEIEGVSIHKGAKFKSLSAAAEFFSKIKRKSGWVYWRTAEGRTLKDAYKG